MREKIISTVKETIHNNLHFVEDIALIDKNDVEHIATQIADGLINAGCINGVDFINYVCGFPRKHFDKNGNWTCSTFYEARDIIHIREALKAYLKGIEL